jgi:hypothetical protein
MRPEGRRDDEFDIEAIAAAADGDNTDVGDDVDDDVWACVEYECERASEPGIPMGAPENVLAFRIAIDDIIISDDEAGPPKKIDLARTGPVGANAATGAARSSASSSASRAACSRISASAAR